MNAYSCFELTFLVEVYSKHDEYKSEEDDKEDYEGQGNDRKEKTCIGGRGSKEQRGEEGGKGKREMNRYNVNREERGEREREQLILKLKLVTIANCG